MTLHELYDVSRSTGTGRIARGCVLRVSSQGHTISADALHTQHAFCFSVTRWDGDYVLLAKDNQARLLDDLRQCRPQLGTDACSLVD